MLLSYNNDSKSSSLSLACFHPMRFGKYHFKCRFVDPAFLPPYKGSTFRGVFGHALKRIVCVLKTQSCPQCPLKQSCLYTQVFESALEGNSYSEKTLTSVSPYVIQPPLDTKEGYLAGEDFDFDLLLFGPVNEKFAHFLYSFIEIGKCGIGSKRWETSGCFEVVSVHEGEHLIYSEGSQVVNRSSLGQDIICSCDEFVETKCLSNKLTITLRTPLRIKSDNRLQEKLPFHVLMRAVLRRISSLWASHAGGEPILPYKELIARAADIQVYEDNLHWFDWARYSSRQDSKMLMGGLIGSISYEGQVEPYFSLLKLASMFNIGKQTSFGLGQYTVEVN